MFGPLQDGTKPKRESRTRAGPASSQGVINRAGDLTTEARPKILSQPPALCLNMRAIIPPTKKPGAKQIIVALLATLLTLDGLAIQKVE